MRCELIGLRQREPEGVVYGMYGGSEDGLRAECESHMKMHSSDSNQTCSL